LTDLDDNAMISFVYLNYLRNISIDSPQFELISLYKTMTFILYINLQLEFLIAN